MLPFLFLPFFFLYPFITASPLSIQTTSGLINGLVDSTAPGVAQFLGIPFAEPPIGARRWLPALPKIDGEERIEAQKIGLNCPQYSAAGASVYTLDVPEFTIVPNRTSEDCLTLNVWAPYFGGNGGEGWQEKEKLPVIVWIYGGGWQTGGGDIKYQIPSNWVRRSRKHIVVGINYRVNIFGFPNAAGLKGEELNLGLLDQRLGLEWVRSNIAKFGGDTSRITLWGQSAGAGSVDYYNYAYAHDPIISSLIMDSGTAFIPVGTNDQNHTSFSTVAAHFKCPTTPPQAELDCLRQIPQQDIEAFLAAPGNASLSFNPVVDNRTKFANYTTQSLERNFTLLPAIIGTNTNEGVPFLPYPTTPEGRPNQATANTLTLNILLCPADYTTKLRYQAGAKTYRYLYAGNFSNIAPKAWEGAYHSSELPLLFGTSGIVRGESTNFEKALSERMQDLWVAFASDAQGGLEREGWEEYKPGGDAVVFGSNGVVVSQIGVNELEAPCNGVVGREGASSPLAPTGL